MGLSPCSLLSQSGDDIAIETDIYETRIFDARAGDQSGMRKCLHPQLLITIGGQASFRRCGLNGFSRRGPAFAMRPPKQSPRTRLGARGQGANRENQKRKIHAGSLSQIQLSSVVAGLGSYKSVVS